jgi:hypothetical protein
MASAGETGGRRPEKPEPQSSGPDHSDNKPIPKRVRETGGADAEKAGAQEQRVNIGNAARRDHNL